MAGRAVIDCDEFLDRAAVVALDAGDAEDVRLVEKHAAACPDCQVRLDEFREAAAGLGSIVTQVEPPEAVRSRLLEAIRREPRPLAVVRRLWPRLVGPRRRISAAWVVAAASFVVALASLGWVAMLQGQITDLQRSVVLAGDRAARFDHVVQVLASDRLAVRPLVPMAQDMPSTGYVFMDPASGEGMLMCHDLPPLDQSHAYQVWFVRGSELVSGGMLWPDHSGNGYTLIRVPQDLQSFDSVNLTVEPGSGSQWPTTPRIMASRLSGTSQ